MILWYNEALFMSFNSVIINMHIPHNNTIITYDYHVYDYQIIHMYSIYIYILYYHIMKSCFMSCNNMYARILSCIIIKHSNICMHIYHYIVIIYMHIHIGASAVLSHVTIYMHVYYHMMITYTITR